MELTAGQTCICNDIWTVSTYRHDFAGEGRTLVVGGLWPNITSLLKFSMLHFTNQRTVK